MHALFGYGGGGLVNQLRKSYSLSDLSDPSLDASDGHDSAEVVIIDPRLRRRRSPSRASASSSLYFTEVDVLRTDRIQHVQSAEDISSGYSSGEGLYPGQPPKLQAREGLVRTGSLTRPRPTRVTRSTSGLKKPSLSEESDDSEVFDTNVIFLNDKASYIDQLRGFESSEEEFVDTVESLHDTIELTACPAKIVEETETEPEKVRKGKYHKKAAPKPPNPQVPTIKATLVLKPGVVKPLGTHSECKEIFIQSPKSKRRTLINRSLSLSKGKIDSSLSKLINFPKKIKNTLEKRSSWHEIRTKDQLCLVESKVQSKSDNDLKSVGKVEKTASRFSIHSLTESPMAHRRLRIIRRYVDEDID